MKLPYWPVVRVACLAGLVACSGGDDDGGVITDAAPGADSAGIDGEPAAECDKSANVARRDALLASQPAIGVDTRAALTVTVTFPSEAGDASVDCPVDLQFKDSNGNGTLDGYEDWRGTAQVRAADLLPRLSLDQKLGLMAHATTTDVPTTSSSAPSQALQALITTGHVRFGVTAANTASLVPRATWANNIQKLAEAQSLGIPFVLSMEPAHSTGNGRTKARSFSQWPLELSLAASGDTALIEQYGKVVAQEYRAIGVRMALSPSADLFTEPRWPGGPFTFGDDSTAVGNMVAAYITGMQGAALGRSSVACVVNHFPGAGPAGDGWDARLAKGKLVGYPAGNIDAHLAPFAKAFDAGVAGVMPGYGILASGAWTGLGGMLDGSTIEQVGVSFNAQLLTDVLRTHYDFGGLVLAPAGILEDPGVSPLGAPWGLESMTAAQRLAKAVNAGVDQFSGLDDPSLIGSARTAGLITDARIDAAATHALELIFQLGLFEDPYVDAAAAPAAVNTDMSYRAGLDAMNRGMVLLVNNAKPSGWLNGEGDGTQSGDKGNAGNGSLKVLPAPPGEPYVSAGCAYFVMGNFDLDYVRSVSAGYGELTNDATAIDGVTVTTAAERIARSDYVFIRIDSPFSLDPDSGSLARPLGSLEYAGSANASELDDVAFARAAIDALPGSQTQIVVAVDAARAPVVSEILSHDVSALYLDWSVSDKVFLDVAFGIANGVGKLAVGLPLSDAAAAAQQSDRAGDGQHATFVKGHGLQTTSF